MKSRIDRAREEQQALGDVPAQLAALEGMTVGALAAKYQELYGEPTRSRNRDYLRKRLAWRIQELAEGGLAPTTLAQIAKLGDKLPERWRMRQVAPLPQPPAPSAPESKPGPSVAAPGKQRDPRLPPVGTVLSRVYEGVTHAITVEAEGFTYAGQRFKTLSAVAKHITGTPWNGFTFVGLTKPAEQEEQR